MRICDDWLTVVCSAHQYSILVLLLLVFKHCSALHQQCSCLVSTSPPTRPPSHPQQASKPICCAAAVKIQLPWTPLKTLSPEEAAAAAARRAAKTEELRTRMKHLAATRRMRLIEEKQDYLEFLVGIQEQV